MLYRAVGLTEENNPATFLYGGILGKKKSNGYGDGTFVKSNLILSPAFLSLGLKGSCEHVSAASQKILMMLLGKRQYRRLPGKRGGGKAKPVRVDDNKFTLTYKEIMSYGRRKKLNGEWVKGVFTQPTVTRGFDELLTKGFISIARYGGAYDKDKQEYSLEKDWVNWKWGDPPIRTRRKARKRGYQGNKKQNTAYASVAHPHKRQRCTPPMETQTPALHTTQVEKNSVNVSGVGACSE